MSRIQWNVSIWEKAEMSMGKLRLGKTTPNILIVTLVVCRRCCCV
uniref:Uncharacterized protein n=1 Tax=Rhizophora mucronata TaxID=61149 RepID=A0A2P2ISK0_RHIMU